MIFLQYTLHALVAEAISRWARPHEPWTWWNDHGSLICMAEQRRHTARFKLKAVEIADASSDRSAGKN